MADKKALYSTCVAVLGFVCFVVGATAVGLPMWGYFDTPNDNIYQESPEPKKSKQSIFPNGLEEILNSDSEGRIVLAKRRNLDNDARQKLCKIVINFLLRNNERKKIPGHEFQLASEEICALFPTEKKEIYFIPYKPKIGPCPKVLAKGKLWARYVNIKRALKSASSSSTSNTSTAGPGSERGYFGPWKTCKMLTYNRERCGKDESRFRPSIVVWVAGIVAAFGVAILGVFCFLSILQLAMVTSKERVVLKYSAVVIAKLAAGLLATLLAVAGAGLFALQADDRKNTGFEITRGPAFYIQVLLILLNAILFVMSLYDMLFSRRDGGDPTKVASTTVDDATTYGNPGFRERGANGRGVSMTDASGKPYVGTASAAANGSMASMNTTMTSASSNGSTVASSVTRSPLRSSLKKPKQKDSLGIQNPGFSGTSPTLSRNGSTKKVRIQTHSTEV